MTEIPVVYAGVDENGEQWTSTLNGRHAYQCGCLREADGAVVSLCEHHLEDSPRDRDCASCGDLIYGYPGDICDECQLGWYEIAFERLSRRVDEPHSAADLAETVYALIEEAKQRMGSNARADTPSHYSRLVESGQVDQ